jgi:hypothetical protein
MTAYQALPVACALSLCACLLSQGAPNDDDGGVNDGGGSYCALTLTLVSQQEPLAPATLQVAATAERVGLVSGIESFSWQVLDDDLQEIPIEPQDPDARQVTIAAIRPGPYRVTVAGQVGSTTCSSATEIINVGAPGASKGLFRLRLVPAPGQLAPPQEQIIEIPGGTNYDLGAVAMSRGIGATGSVHSAAGSPLAAYVRVTPASELGATALEAFAGPGGEFALRVENRVYELLVVPEDNEIAPRRFASRLPGDFALSVDPGIAIGGVVADPAGAPLAGARVALRVDGVPSTLATTGAGGAFTLRARPGNASLSVAPAHTGLPRLDLLSGVVVDSASSLAITYAGALQRRQITGLRVVDASGAAAAGARVMWISRPMSAAGSVRVDDGASVPLTGSVRAAQVAGADGTLPAIELAEALYDVIVEPGGVASPGAVTLIEVDLRAGAPTPSFLALALAARVSGVVRSADGTPLASVRVTAAPTGTLALAPGATATAWSTAGGAFALDVAGRGEYRLFLTGADARHGRAWRDLLAPAPEQTVDMGDVFLPRTLAVTGRMSLSGAGSSAGVILRLLCYACEGQDPTWPLAEAVTDAGGEFTLAVPDPGAAQP